MSDADSGRVVIESEYDIVTARKVVREAAVGLGFGVTDVTRIVTAASELTRNIYLYAGSGTVTWREVARPNPGIEIEFADSGPGIDDVDTAMQPGFTSGKGMGMGLPGAKRLMDEFEVRSSPGEGTVVVIRKWLRV